MNNAPQGWQCPACRTVHAPWVASCDCVKQPTFPIVIPYLPYGPPANPYTRPSHWFTEEFKTTCDTAGDAAV